MVEAQAEFVAAASEDTLQRVAQAMKARNFDVVVVEDGDAARVALLERLPKGAEVFSGRSKTLQDAGIFDAVHDVTQYDALRPKMLKMDRATQMQAIRKLIGAPDYMLGSVNAVTADGVLVVASATGSQLGPYANTAGKVILVVGSQKIVPDLETALRRVREHVLPWEDEQVRKLVATGSFIAKTLIIEREARPDRTTVILVRQAIGI